MWGGGWARSQKGKEWGGEGESEMHLVFKFKERKNLIQIALNCFCGKTFLKGTAQNKG